MPNIKSAALSTGHISNKEKQARLEAEEKIKGSTIIAREPPKGLSANGKKAYRNIIAILPEGFLNGSDHYIVGIVAEAIDRMSIAQKKINKDGLFINIYEVINGEKKVVGSFENEAVKTYDRYSKIFEKFSTKIGLSPKDRAALAIINLDSDDKRNDELLNILSGK